MRKYIADPVKFCLYFGTALFLLVAGIGGLVYQAWVFAVVFLVASGAFLAFSLEYAATVELSTEGVRRTSAIGRKTDFLDFSHMGEVGVVGTNPRNPNPDTGNKTGVLYIYFSAQPLTGDQRQALTCSFPKDIPFLRYTDERYAELCRYWEGEVTHCNTGCKLL